MLTRGDRMAELETALGSIAAQRDVTTERIVVWNGAPAATLPPRLVDRNVELATNVGIPEGRNRGAATTPAPVLLFLDDDARLLDESILAAVVEQFAADPQLGVIGLRLVDERGETSARHVPRLGGRGPDRPGEVTSFPGGACCIRTEAFRAAGGFRGDFVYSMEETELAWRLIDAGWTIRYEPRYAVFHPRTTPSRHPDAAWRTARNRAWMAYRLLPWPLVPAYLTSWLVINLARRSAPTRDYLRGITDGWRTRVGPRRPLRWRTVWRLTRLGRPPVV